jgi:hypothetical protein
VNHQVSNYLKQKQNNTYQQTTATNPPARIEDIYPIFLVLGLLIVLGIAFPKFGSVLMILSGLGLASSTKGCGCLVAIVGLLLLGA